MALARHLFSHNGLHFSYLDSGGSAPPVIALHGHLMAAATYEPLAAALSPAWRLIALDQRGHGDSSHASTYTRAEYIGDIEALFTHLGIERTVLLGSSLGGVNAYQFAAHHPQRVRALVIEDIGAVISDDIRFVLDWQGVLPTRDELAARVGPRFAPYLACSFRQTASGWTLAFDPREMVVSQGELCGDHWPDWLASRCPALLLRGSESRVTTAAHLQEMTALRPNTQLITLNGGHILHIDDRERFHATVLDFLAQLEP